jgi:hypothetical protein
MLMHRLTTVPAIANPLSRPSGVRESEMYLSRTPEGWWAVDETKAHRHDGLEKAGLDNRIRAILARQLFDLTRDIGGHRSEHGS